MCPSVLHLTLRTPIHTPLWWLQVRHAEVLLDGEQLDAPWPLGLLLHKPVGYVVTSPDDENVPDPKVYDLLPYR